MAQNTNSNVGSPDREDLGFLHTWDPNQIGVLIFVSSEAVFFLGLIVTYLAYRSQYVSERGPTPGSSLNVALTTFFTIFLFASSFTMAAATSRLARRHAVAARRWLYATVLLGLTFLVGQGYEYVSLYRDSVTLGTNLWTSTFFTLTGFHGLHVLAGLIAILTASVFVRARPEGVGGVRGLEAVSVYWHFVDLVWVVIFPVVYLWTLIS